MIYFLYCMKKAFLLDCLHHIFFIAAFVLPVLAFVIYVPGYAVIAACSLENIPFINTQISEFANFDTKAANALDGIENLIDNGVVSENGPVLSYKTALQQWGAQSKDYIDALQRYKVALDANASASSYDEHVMTCSVAVSENQRLQNVGVQLKSSENIINQLQADALKWHGNTNDPLAASQFYLRPIDKVDTIPSDHKVIVAVIDEGVNIYQEDLVGHIWTNSNEVDGNGIDDDGNGFIDDVHGYNFVKGSGELTPYGSHGTHVAGLIAASQNNGKGIEGIARNALIMPLIVGDDKTIPMANVVSAIKYAVNNGADIINLSLGLRGTQSYSTDYDDAIGYAFERGVLVVASAGNGDILNGSGEDTGVYKTSPVCNDNAENMVLGVGAINIFAQKAPWSNFGPCVDLYAPGESILSTAVSAFDGSEYAIDSGTSFSAPIVTGVAAELKAIYSDLNPKEIVYHLKNTARIIKGIRVIDMRAALGATPKRVAMDLLPRVVPQAIDCPPNSIPLNGTCVCLVGYEKDAFTLTCNSPTNQPATPIQTPVALAMPPAQPKKESNCPLVGDTKTKRYYAKNDKRVPKIVAKNRICFSDDKQAKTKGYKKIK